MLKKIVLLSFFLSLGFQAILAQDSFDRKRKPPKQLAPQERAIEELNLSEEQKTKFDKIVSTNQESNIDLRYQIEKKQLEFKKELDSKQNSEVLLKVNKEIGDLENKIKENMLKTWIEIKSILNEEQKEEWTKHLKFMQDRKERPRR